MKSPENSFAEARSALSDMIWIFIEALNQERGVSHCGFERTRDFQGTPTSETCKGQVWTVAQTYQGARQTINGIEIAPDRIIDIKIAATEDWTPIVTVTNSIRDIPIQIDGGDEANIQHAIKAVHDEIFQDWPPTEDEIAEFIRGQLPVES